MNQVTELPKYFVTDAESGNVNYRGRPSQVTNIPFYAGRILIIVGILSLYFMVAAKWDLSPWFALVPIFFFVWTALRRCVESHYVRIEIDNDRITWRTGVFSRTTETVEIYRIQNVTARQGFVERLFGIGTVYIETVDPTHPWINLWGMRNPEQMRLWLTQYVQVNRRFTGFREFTSY